MKMEMLLLLLLLLLVVVELSLLKLIMMVMAVGMIMGGGLEVIPSPWSGQVDATVRTMTTKMIVMAVHVDDRDGGPRG